MMRKIIHIDMDAFFASVEQRDDPQLKGKPVVVGGSGKRSVVAAASYEAREFGIFSAMPISLARKKCSDLIIVPHRFSVYKEISHQIREVFYSYTNLVEPLSLDEAYLDVTKNSADNPSATLLAREIKKKINDQTSLTCSAGVSVNKFIAKVASGMNKPNGLTTITPGQIPKFLDHLPVGKFHGVGKVTEEKMKSLDIHTGADLKKIPLDRMVELFGKTGHYYYKVCRGEDDRPVSAERVRKSVSVERTFEENIYEWQEADEILTNLIGQLSNALQRLDVKGRTIQLKWRYPDFTTPTRSKSFHHYTRDAGLITESFEQLFREHVKLELGIRLLGVGMANLDTEYPQSQLILDL